MLQDAKQNIKISQEKQKEQYDRKHSCSLMKFDNGTQVLKKDFRRKKRKGGCMDHKWLGPYEILKDVGKGFFALKCLNSGKIIDRVHGAHLKIYQSPLLSKVNIVLSYFCLNRNRMIVLLHHAQIMKEVKWYTLAFPFINNYVQSVSFIQESDDSLSNTSSRSNIDDEVFYYLCLFTPVLF